MERIITITMALVVASIIGMSIKAGVSLNDGRIETVVSQLILK